MPLFIYPPIIDADAVLDRYVNFMKKASTLTVSMTIANSLILGEGSAKVTFAKPNRTAFSSSWSGRYYSFFQDARHVIEIDRSAKKYREWPTFHTFVTPPNEVTTLGHYTFPKLLLLGDFRFIGNNPKKQLLPAPPGAKIQTVMLKYETQNGPADLEVSIDEFGRPVRTAEAMIIDGRQVSIKVTYSNWITNRKYPASTFAGALEPGYTSQALNLEDIPIQWKEKFSFQNWVKDGQSGTIQSVLSTKKYILVAVRNDCEYSERLLNFLEQNSKQIQELGATIGVLSLDDNLIKSKFPVFVDPKGKGIVNLRIAGTPTMFSVSSAGMTKQVWFPVITDQPTTLLKEILASLK